MKKAAVLVSATLFVLSLGFGAEARGRRPLSAEIPRVILAFQTMFGVDGPFVGEANAIRGIAGDELPWEIASAQGVLDTNGHLIIRVRGLVFKDDPSVPPELRGINDEDHFRAVVSCLAEDTPGHVGNVNITTEGFPATRSGNSNINAKVELPENCVAPIIFVIAGSEDKWFSVTGIEAEED